MLNRNSSLVLTRTVVPWNAEFLEIHLLELMQYLSIYPTTSGTLGPGCTGTAHANDYFKADGYRLMSPCRTA